MDHSAKLPTGPAIEAPGQATPQDPQATQGPTTGPTASDNAQNAPDPSKPLPDPIHEAFAQHIVAGFDQCDAYKRARPGRIRGDTARSQASRWIRRPEIAARVRALRVEAAKSAKQAQDATPAQHPQPARRERSAPPAASSAQVVDKQELLVMLSHAVRNGQLDGQTLNALLKVHPDLTAGTDQRPDGAMVAAYLAQYGGHKGKAAVEAMGGLPAMARKLAGALGCTLAELGEACRT